MIIQAACQFSILRKYKKIKEYHIVKKNHSTLLSIIKNNFRTFFYIFVVFRGIIKKLLLIFFFMSKRMKFS